MTDEAEKPAFTIEVVEYRGAKRVDLQIGDRSFFVGDPFANEEAAQFITIQLREALYTLRATELVEMVAKLEETAEVISGTLSELKIVRADLERLHGETEGKDVWGVDDDDVYHPPNRRRYEQICAIIDAAEAFVRAWDGTATVNERGELSPELEALRAALPPVARNQSEPA